jgi:hypothetical protein
MKTTLVGCKIEMIYSPLCSFKIKVRILLPLHPLPPPDTAQEIEEAA